MFKSVLSVFIQYSFLFLINLLFFSALNAQVNNRFSLSPSYGLGISFFAASANYGEVVEPPRYSILRKNLAGSYGGLEAGVRLSQTLELVLGFSISQNTREVNLQVDQSNVALINWHISQRMFYHSLGVRWQLSEGKFALGGEAGLFYVRPRLQEIEILDIGPNGYVLFEERDQRDYNLEEIGAYLGVLLERSINENVGLGIRTRLQAFITAPLIENLSLTSFVVFKF